VNNSSYLYVPYQRGTLLLAGGEIVWASWKYVEEEENMPFLRYTKEVMGAYVTTGAPLIL
jgi:hypothetical protein